MYAYACTCTSVRARIRARVHTYCAINESGIPEAIVCDERSSKGIKHFHVATCFIDSSMFRNFSKPQTILEFLLLDPNIQQLLFENSSMVCIRKDTSKVIDYSAFEKIWLMQLKEFVWL